MHGIRHWIFRVLSCLVESMLFSEYDGGALESVAWIGAVVFLDPVPMSKMS
jgi:hypothetical protein